MKGRTRNFVTATVAVAAFLALAGAASAAVANPGPFTIGVSGGELQLGLLTASVPGGEVSGQIDSDGKVTIPGTAFQLSNVPFDTTTPISTLSSVHVVGTASFASTGVTGTLDPATGAASLTGGVYATVTFTATAPFLGVEVQLYSGTCSVGSAATPISLTLTTSSPGVAYSQATGAVTLSSALAVPSLSGCSPAIDPLYTFLLDLVAGSGRLTIAGATNPVLVAPGATSASGPQTVTAEVGATVLTVRVPSSISFPTIYPGQTSSPVAAPITVISNDGFGYQLTVERSAFTGGDIPLSIQSDAVPLDGMLLDLNGLTPIPVTGSTSTALRVGHRSNTISGADGDVWPTSLVLGPVPNVPSGQHTSTLTYTVVGF